MAVSEAFETAKQRSKRLIRGTSNNMTLMLAANAERQTLTSSAAPAFF
jgi:hypothetical protein